MRFTHKDPRLLKYCDIAPKFGKWLFYDDQFAFWGKLPLVGIPGMLSIGYYG